MISIRIMPHLFATLLTEQNSMSNIRQRSKTSSKNSTMSTNNDGERGSPLPDDITTPASPNDSPQSWEKSFEEEDDAGILATGTATQERTKSSVKQQQHSSMTVPSASPSSRYCKFFDKFLTVWGKFGGNTFTAEQGLKIVQYSLWAVIYSKSKQHQRNGNGRSNGNGGVSPDLRKIYSDLSMSRYVFRMYGFFDTISAYRSGSWAGGTWDNPLIAIIAKYLLAGSMIFYYPLDHLAYIGWQMPQTVGRRINANKVSQISCLFWSVYTISDFWVSTLKWNELQARLGSLELLLTGKKKKKTDDSDMEAVADIVKEKAVLIRKIRHIKLQLMRCILFVLPCINWSLNNWATDPLLSEFVLNGLCLTEAYTAVYQSILSML